MRDNSEEVTGPGGDPEAAEAAVDATPTPADSTSPTQEVTSAAEAATPSPDDGDTSDPPAGGGSLLPARDTAQHARVESEPAPAIDPHVTGAEGTSPDPPSDEPAAQPPRATADPAVRSHAQPPSPRSLRRRRRRRRAGIALITLLVLALGSLSTYLYLTTEAWQEHAERYLATAEDLGEEVWATQASLDGARAELEAVREQLRTAQQRIITLADEKAQIGDDREIARQLSDYQARVTDAAGRVALALDECVQGQQMLIGYLENSEAYDQEALDQFAVEVDTLCQAATEANIALQRELAR